MRITLCGAAGEVTGSSYYVETSGARVLVDFGMFQGSRMTEARNRETPPIEFKRLDAVIATHAHIDHTGRMPMLPKLGYQGPIYATPASIDFAHLLLEDSAEIQESDARRAKKRLERSGREAMASPEPLYTPDDVKRVLPTFRAIPYEKPTEIAPGISVRLVDAGHILGSASIEMTVTEGGASKVIAFSGDIGHSNVPILRDPVPLKKADLVFLESTYGDRDHRGLQETVGEFAEIIKQAVWERQKILIPAFAVGRTQQLIYYFGQLYASGRVPRVPIYLDSPMGIDATRIYAKHYELYDEEAAKLARAGAFHLPELTICRTSMESRRLNDVEDSCVIIAGSGMCNAGRIVHHLYHNLWRKYVSVIITGFQAQGSLGRRLVNKEPFVRMGGRRIAVRAKVHTLGGFSAHAGKTELLEWLSHSAGQKPRVVLTHGEDGARAALRGAIKEQFGLEARVPGMFEVVEM
jgi:metallo-beta-lactamase family protein